jgi:hypothetical protein
MSYHPFSRRCVSAFAACLALTLFATTDRCHAGLLFELLGPRATTGQVFEADLFLEVIPELITVPESSPTRTIPFGTGLNLDYIDFDLRETVIDGAKINPADYARVDFLPQGGFTQWFDGTQFGDPLLTNAYLISIDGFFNPSASPKALIDGERFQVGTFRFDYSGLGLQAGDAITLDLTSPDPGVGNLRNTAAAVSESPGTLFATDLINFDFGAGNQGGRVTYQVPSSGGPDPPKPVVPEPGSGLIFLATSLLTVVALRRRKQPALRGLT